MKSGAPAIGFRHAPSLRTGESVAVVFHDIRGRAMHRQAVKRNGESALSAMNPNPPGGLNLVRISGGNAPLPLTRMVLN
jgi:hypothetical protein